METNISYIKRLIFLIGFFLLFSFFSSQKLYAQGAVISISPQTGSYSSGNNFNASVIIDGGGTAFNAAKATVVISQNLSVQNLVLGDCDFAYVKTPEQASPSFAGVILGGSSKKCTVYTLTLKGVSSGNASVFLSNASVKSYQGASEILLSLQNGSYTINPGSSGYSQPPIPTEAPVVYTNGNALYNLIFSLSPPSGASVRVVLDQNKPYQQTAIPEATKNGSSTVTFENVSAGVHTVSTLDNGKPVSKQIINVSGNNRNIALGLGKKTSINWLFYLVAAILLGILIFVGYKLYRRKVARGGIS